MLANQRAENHHATLLFLKCTCISLVQSHQPIGPNDSENVPTYISTNIIGKNDIIVPNDAKIKDQKWNNQRILITVNKK